MFYILNYFENYFKIALNRLVYKMTQLPLPWVRGVTAKGYQSTIFKPRNATPLRTKYELNHASECQTLSGTKSQANEAFGKEILRRNSYMKIDTIGSQKHAYRDTSC